MADYRLLYHPLVVSRDLAQLDCNIGGDSVIVAVEGAGAGHLYLAQETNDLFGQAEKLSEEAGDSYVTAERILLETDAPYLTPVPHRGKSNAPYYLPFIAEQVADTMALEVEELLGQVYRNSLALFFGRD